MKDGNAEHIHAASLEKDAFEKDVFQEQILVLRRLNLMAKITRYIN
jgi:hypothetical protein